MALKKSRTFPSQSRAGAAHPGHAHDVDKVATMVILLRVLWYVRRRVHTAIMKYALVTIYVYALRCPRHVLGVPPGASSVLQALPCLLGASGMQRVRTRTPEA